MKFSDIPYDRPDMRAFAAAMRAHASRLASAKDVEEAAAAVAGADGTERFRFEQ